MIFEIYKNNHPQGMRSFFCKLRVYNKVCKLEKVAYTLFNLREV